MRHSGQIESWNDEKGYGFITPDERSPRVFLHIRDLEGRGTRPRVGDRVQYELTKDERGRPRAANARLKRRLTISMAGVLRILIAVVFLGAVYIGVQRGAVERWVLWAYLIASMLAWIDYWHDKRKARKGRWRISEQTLHLWSLLGGWPGALLAQQFLRHKNRKLSFQFQFWGIVLLHLALWAWHFRSTPLIAGLIGST